MKIFYKTFFNLIAITAIGTFSSVGVAKEINPIKFNQGSVVGTASGQIPSGKQDTWYQFKAQKGQYAVINLLPKAGSPETANVGVLYMPSKHQNGGKGGIVYQGCLPEDGKYKLRIARNLMATENKNAGYQVEVVILPQYASKELCD